MKKEKKVLFVATVVKTHINVFHLPYLKMLKEMGYKTYVAAKNDFVNEPCVIPYCDNYIDIPFERNPLNKNNISAYRMLKKVIDKENFDIIHCHTPVGGALTRIAARKYRKKGTKVIYTAHGFHFYKGAPLKNWLMYYPAEMLCSYWTDVLITINKEDYALAQRKMKAKKIVYVPGVGIDLEKYSGIAVDKEAKKNEMGIPDGKVWILTVGELIKRKNHETLIRAVFGIENAYLTIAGRGELYVYLQNLIAELNLSDRVKLLGFRSDISELCSAADMFVFPSFQEGLPVALMEAMASSLPCAVSRIRGNTDLFDDNSLMFDPHSVNECRTAIEKVLSSDMEALGKYNKEKISGFDLKKIVTQMNNEYCELLFGRG